MPAQILVSYATRYGSTREVAETVAATLREHSLDVDVQPVGQVGSLDGYRAVVLGTPLFIGKWLKDFGSFLTSNQASLSARTVAVFGLGPCIDPTSETERKGARDQLDTQLAKMPWLAPVAVEMFGGKYDPAKLRGLDKLIAALPASPLHGVQATDARDWDAIRVWASDLAARLQPGQAG